MVSKTARGRKIIISGHLPTWHRDTAANCSVVHTAAVAEQHSFDTPHRQTSAPPTHTYPTTTTRLPCSSCTWTRQCCAIFGRQESKALCVHELGAAQHGRQDSTRLTCCTHLLPALTPNVASTHHFFVQLPHASAQNVHTILHSSRKYLQIIHKGALTHEGPPRANKLTP